MIGLNKFVFGVKDLKKVLWNVFEKDFDFDKKGDKVIGIWLEKFELVILKILNDIGKEECDICCDIMCVINKFWVMEFLYNFLMEVVVCSWVEGSIIGMKMDKIFDNECKEDLIVSLEDEIIQFFFQLDKLYFYSNFQGILYQNIFSLWLMD